jgi:HSP20 family protein
MPAQGEWDPMRELMTVQKRMNKLFESALARTDFETQHEVDSWTPVADVYETAEALVLSLELPGFELKQIDLRLDADDLVVEGEQTMERERPGDRFHRVERSYGRFSRRFHLPSAVDREAIDATYRNGVLRVTLPHKGHRPSRAVRVSIR